MKMSGTLNAKRLIIAAAGLALVGGAAVATVSSANATTPVSDGNEVSESTTLDFTGVVPAGTTYLDNVNFSGSSSFSFDGDAPEGATKHVSVVNGVPSAP